MSDQTSPVACGSAWHAIGATRAQPVCLDCHPAEPGPVVTDEAVEAAALALGGDEFATQMDDARAALEAAAPLLGPRPLLNREQALSAMISAVYEEGDTAVVRQGMASAEWTLLSIAADSVMVLARPMPTREQIAKALHEHDMADVWDDEGCNDTLGGVHTSCKDSYLANADAVLALINGGAK